MAKFVLTAQLQLQAPRNVNQVVNQIQNQLRGVAVDIDVRNAAKTQREIQNLSRTTDKAADSAKRMGSAFNVSLKRFAGLALATRAVSLFTNTLGGAVKEAISFERELIKISQVTGKSISQLRDLTKTITSLSTSLGSSSSALLNVSRSLSQAGFSAKETEIALSTLARTTLAPTFDDITKTAEGAIAVFNQFGRGAEALEQQLGAINAVAGKFAVEAGDLISTVRRTGGVFKSAGGDLNELIALFTSVRSTTRESAESIATGLRTIFTRIQRPKTIDFMKQFGVQLTDLEGKFVGPFEATMRLSKALAGLEQGDITFVRIAEELGGFRQIGKVIPLIQQARVAQEALNVAQRGGDSLAADAAKAQQTLAVRIVQTQEKFIALVRSISETTAFQLMANSVLALADGLVKVGEAIKPVLPLIAALGASRGIAALGGFGGKASKMVGMNKGGSVPGTGNRDTVPAMLTPGEFVIRKESVKSLGAENLHKMNKYASGGIVTADRHGYGKFGANSPAMKAAKRATEQSDGVTAWRNKSQNERQAEAARIDAAGRKKGSERVDPKKIKSATLSGEFGVSFLRGNAGSKGLNATIGQVLKESNKTGADRLKSSLLKRAGSKSLKDINYNNARITATGAVPTYLQGDGGKIFRDEIEAAVPQMFSKATESFTGELRPSAALPLNKLVSKSAIGSIEGQFFEAFIRSVTNNTIKDPKKDEIFDFAALAASKSDLERLFGDNPFVLPNEFKNDANSAANRASAIGKAMSLPGTQLRFYNKGGNVKDTVPAMLTPGEFVVNKASAQKIGYNNLKQMNKVKGYNAGGVVTGNRHNYGVESAGNPLTDLLYGKGKTDAGGDKKLADGAAKASKGMAKLAGAAFATTAALSAIIPAAKENENVYITGARSLNQSLMTIIGGASTAGFALQSFGKDIDVGALLKNKFVGPLAAAGTAAFIVSKTFHSLENSSARLKKSIEDGNKAQAVALSTQASTSGARSGVSMGVGLAAGAGVGLLTATAGLPVALTAAALAAGAFALGTELSLSSMTDGFQDFLSMFGASTSAQIKAQTALTISSNDFETALKKLGTAANTAAEAMKQGNANLAGSLDILADTIQKERQALITDTNNKFKVDQDENVGSLRGKVLTNMSSNLATQQKLRSGDLKSQNITRMPVMGADVFEVNTKGLIKEITVLSQTIEQLRTTGGSQEEINKNVRRRDLLGSVNVQGDSFFRNSKTASGVLGKNESISQEATKARQEANKRIFDQSAPVLNIERRRFLRQQAGNQGSTENVSFEDFRKSLSTAGESGKLFAEILGDLSEADLKETRQAFDNVAKEVDRARKAFLAINVDLRSVTSSATATTAGLNSLITGFTTGASQLQSDFATITAAMGSAGENMRPEDVEKALGGVTRKLAEFGADDATVNKVSTNVKAFAKVQQQFPALVKDVKSQLSDVSGNLTTGNPQDVKDAFKKAIENSLDDSVGEEARKRIINAFDAVELKPDQQGRLSQQQFDVFGEIIQGISQDQLKQFESSVAAVVEAENKMLVILNKKIATENDLIKAQQSAIDIFKEARQIEAEFGGKRFTPADRKASLSSRANVLGRGAGLTDIDSNLSVDSLRQRNAEIKNRFQGNRSALDAGGADASTKADIQESQNRLKAAQKEQIQTIRELVSIQRDELKIIQEKNRLEKDSIDSLLGGNIEKFFDQQAAQGAISAASGGDQRLMDAFGPQAMNDARVELARMRDAGVQDVNGVNLDGRGGLLETVSIDAARQRGLGSAALQAGRLAAGTDDKSLAAKQNLRNSAGLLAETGDLGADMAQMEVDSVNEMMVKAQTVVLEAKTIGDTNQRIRDNRDADRVVPVEIKKENVGNTQISRKAAGDMHMLRRGGVVYANQGMFVPRGTDTVPAMLTPGEFVVRREAVQRGNNLAILKSMNSVPQQAAPAPAAGYANGGVVYRSQGSNGPEGGMGISMEAINKLSESFRTFNEAFGKNIKQLADTKFSVSLDNNNINVNLNGGSFLQSLSESLKKSLLQEVGNQLAGFKPSSTGLKEGRSVLPVA